MPLLTHSFHLSNPLSSLRFLFGLKVYFYNRSALLHWMIYVLFGERFHAKHLPGMKQESKAGQRRFIPQPESKVLLETISDQMKDGRPLTFIRRLPGRSDCDQRHVKSTAKLSTNALNLHSNQLHRWSEQYLATLTTKRSFFAFNSHAQVGSQVRLNLKEAKFVWMLQPTVYFFYLLTSLCAQSLFCYCQEAKILKNNITTTET